MCNPIRVGIEDDITELTYLLLSMKPHLIDDGLPYLLVCFEGGTRNTVPFLTNGYKSYLLCG